jgi:hypothetical protein
MMETRTKKTDVRHPVQLQIVGMASLMWVRSATMEILKMEIVAPILA